MDKKARLKKLSQTLLASTCLTAAAAVTATASTFDESMIDGGFGGNFGAANVLPTGTTIVTGSFCGDCGNVQDWFTIPGLKAGDTIQVTGSLIAGGPATLGFEALTSGDTPLAGDPSVPASSVFDVTAPADGNIVFEVQQVSGPASGVDYEVAIVDQGGSSAPEPGTAALGTIALGAAAALRRKLKKA
jgi:MYXO-CTERM domain-containing protein